MNSPLARHLTRFGPVTPVAMLLPDPASVVYDPQVTLSVADLEDRLEAARETARTEATAESERALAQLKAEQDGAVERALTAARADWLSEQATSLNASCDAAATALRELVCTRLADVLRPLLADTVIKRAVADLSEAMGRLLADPSHPPIRIRGPHDLIEMLKAMRSDSSGIDFEVCETVEVTMNAEGAHVETQIAAALAVLFPEAHS